MKRHVQGSNTALLTSRHVVQSIICSLLPYPDMWASFFPIISGVKLSFVHYHKMLASVIYNDLLGQGQIFICSNNKMVKFQYQTRVSIIVFIEPLLK